MYTAGIDEVGRGPLAGPVTIGLVALQEGGTLSKEALLSLFPKGLLKDSKKLSKTKREALAKEVHLLSEKGQLISLTASRNAHDIDQRGISTCIKECISEVLLKLLSDKKIEKEGLHILLDGSLSADPSFPSQKTIIKGDEKEILIALASIIAKVERDTSMENAATLYPEYHFEKHMGYGTKKHCEAIEKYGLSDLHRKTYTKRYQR